MKALHKKIAWNGKIPITTYLFLIFATVIVIMTSFFSAFFPWAVAYADEKRDIVAEFEKTGVLDDLMESKVDGEPFTLEKYAFDNRKKTQVFSFVEFCYSFYESRQSDYGLYLYVYNPKGLRFVANSVLNTVTLRAGESENLPLCKYPLLYLNRSEEANYEGLFYKFKVLLTAEQRQAFLEAVNSSNRTYRVSEIELLEEENTNATVINVGTTYSFKGYAGGYGSNAEAGSTLTCSSEQFDTLTLKPHATVYRPGGTNKEGESTQDSLHSVYFAVPNKFIETYGEMSAVHATWLNAVLAPSLVTGNAKAYAAIEKYLGVNIGTYEEGLDYHYYGAYQEFKFNELSSNEALKHLYGFGYNGKVPTLLNTNIFLSGEEIKNDSAFARYEYLPRTGYDIETLYMMYSSGEGTDSADSYVVSSAAIKDKLVELTQKYGGELVNGKYSKVLFDQVDAEPTVVNIRRDEKYALTSEKISRNWFEKLFHLKGDVAIESGFDGIEAIYAVKATDLEGTAEEVCRRLYISTADYEAFKEYFAENTVTSTVYLFRYQVSDYISQEATLYTGDCSAGNLFTFHYQDTNAYFFQETVNLDFDIIDVTFSNGEKETVIPVVMSPIDVIPDATPPVHTKSDIRSNWWKIALAVIAVIIVLILLYFVLKLFLGRNKTVVKITSEKSAPQRKPTQKKPAQRKPVQKKPTQKKKSMRRK